MAHTISSNGVAYSGGPSITGAIAPGHHMEITVLQLYKVALSAGKAHRDHKHHHVHHFDHEGLVSTTAQPTQAPQVFPFINVYNYFMIYQMKNHFISNIGNNTTSIFSKWGRS